MLKDTEKFVQRTVRKDEDEIGEEYDYTVSNTLTAGVDESGFYIEIEYSGMYTTRDSYTLNVEEAKRLRDKLDKFIRDS